MTNSFNIQAQISGRNETLLVVPQRSGEDKSYKLVKDGVEFCILTPNGDFGWEVNGTPLNADELDSIGRQIRNH
jgi:hypothetical protein